jgi:hypothetical protein
LLSVGLGRKWCTPFGSYFTFDSNAKATPSFPAVYVYALVDDSIAEIEINPADKSMLTI